MAVLIGRAESQLLVVDVQERLVPAMEPERPFVAACATLLRAADALEIPAIASEQYPKGLGRTVPELADLVPQPHRYEKMEFSCYANMGIRQALAGVNRSQVVLAGIEAHVCVLQTALNLTAAGNAVFVVTDATASRRPESREVAFRRMAGAGVTLVTLEMVLFEWLRSAADPEFRAVSKLIR
jgi:nicotinamidase-related amidase